MQPANKAQMKAASVVWVVAIVLFLGAAAFKYPSNNLVGEGFGSLPASQPAPQTATSTACSSEICDGYDNDCDKLVDEANVCKDSATANWVRFSSIPMPAKAQQDVTVNTDKDSWQFSGCVNKRNSKGEIVPCDKEMRQLRNVVPGEVLVKFRKGSPVKSENDAKSYIAAKRNSKTGKVLPTPKFAKELFGKLKGGKASEKLGGIFKLKFDSSVDLAGLLAEFKKDSNLEFAEPNTIYYLEAIDPAPDDPIVIYSSPSPNPTSSPSPTVTNSPSPNATSTPLPSASPNPSPSGSPIPTVSPSPAPINDPFYPRQWAHQIIQSELAWEIEQGNPGIVIAAVDTGVDFNHEDLAGNIWINPGEDLDQNGVVDQTDFNGIDDDANGYIDDIRGYDFVNLEEYGAEVYCSSTEDCVQEDNDPLDVHGHGTHVAGIIGAEMNNNLGVVGICPNCKVMPVRTGFMTTDGGGGLLTEDIAQALVYAADNGADVISMSFGGGGGQLMEDAINYAYSQGAVLVAAAGNGASKFKSYPAGYENVISVSATDELDQPAWFTNYGSWVDIASPGVAIFSTLPNNQYAGWSGTSMATPLAAGLVGLILSKYPDFSQEEVRNILHTAVETPISQKYLGTGRINAFQSLQIGVIPNAKLNSYLDDITLSGAGDFEIYGTASGNTFSDYYMEYGKGPYPSSWVIFKPPASLEVFNSILATLNTNMLSDGEYSIRLVSRDSGGHISQDKAFLTIMNVRMLWPKDNDRIRLGGIVQVKADVYVPSDNFTMEYLDPSDGIWKSDGISINSILPPEINTVLASWDTRSLAEGYYSLRLVNIARNEELKRISDLYLDPDLKIGWPINIEGSRFGRESNVIVDDLNGDGLMEILLDGSEGTYVWNSIGEMQEGWPIVNRQFPLVTPSSVGDINNDGQKEIVSCFNKSHPAVDGDLTKIRLVSVRDFRGVPLPNFPLTLSVGSGSDYGGWGVDCGIPLLADIDGDGYLEIIFNLALLEHYGSVERNSFITYAINSDGSFVPGWPHVFSNDDPDFDYGFARNAPALGDVDGDGQPELVIVVNQIRFDPQVHFSSEIYVLNSNGGLSPGNWPVSINSLIFSSPSLVDFNGDGKLEIVFGSLLEDGRYFVLDGQGNGFDGVWPRDDFGYGEFASSPAIADLDRDESPEIVQANGVWYNNAVFGWNSDGTDIPGWPVNFDPEYATHSSALIGDITGDGQADVVVGNSDSNLYAWNDNGSRIDGWPKKLDSEIYATGAIADIDNDGNVDILSATWNGQIYAWEGGNYAKETMFWPQFRHDPQHTGIYSRPIDCGDVNGDGTAFNLLDILTLEYILTGRLPVPQNWRNGDIDASNDLTIADFLLLIDSMAHSGLNVCKSRPSSAISAKVEIVEQTPFQEGNSSSIYRNISINLSNNGPLSALEFELSYDPAELEPVKFDNTARSKDMGVHGFILSPGSALVQVQKYNTFEDFKTIPKGVGGVVTIMMKELEPVTTTPQLVRSSFYDSKMQRVRIVAAPFCFDGTLSSTCSSLNYCSNGNFIGNKCEKCGCPGGQLCKKTAKGMQCVNDYTPGGAPVQK
ncbi:MAG: S8 family serine peptidase [Candidatus Micrarchaeota archaeon]